MVKSKNILEQEEEFLKLNSEIDLKTQDLMKQVDQIKKTIFNDEKIQFSWSIVEPAMQVENNEKENEMTTEQIKSDKLNKSSKNGTAFTAHSLGGKDEIRHNSKLLHSVKIMPSLISTQEQESLIALGVASSESDINGESGINGKPGKHESGLIPESLKGIGHDGITRFLSAKVKLLTEQLEFIQKNEKKHVETIKELQARKNKSEEEREKLIQQANSAKNALVKFEKHFESISAQLQEAQIENNRLKKESETLKKEIRLNNKGYHANEIKLNRSLQEIERLKGTLQQMKQEEKEFKETQRKRTEELSNALKNLEKQKMELLNGFKKQLLVIDNLKRQKSLIEARKLLKSAEEDFVNFLDSNPVNSLRHTKAPKSAEVCHHETWWKPSGRLQRLRLEVENSFASGAIEIKPSPVLST